MNLTKKILTLFTFLILTIQFVYSQKNISDALNATQNKEQLKADSLLKVIQKTKNDTLRADLFFQYFELTFSGEWMKYAPQIIESIDSIITSRKLPINLKKALLNRKAKALRYCAYSYDNLGNRQSVKIISYLNDAIKIFAETGNDVELTQTYINRADHYFAQGQLFKQYQTLQEGLKYANERKFNRGISRYYAALQLFYANMGDTSQAVSYIDKATKLESEINDPTRLAAGYYIYGLSYSKLLKHQKAIEYLLLCIKSYENKSMQNRERNLGRAYILLGDEYQIIKDYNKALDVYEKTIEYGTNSEDMRTIFLATLAKGKTMSLNGKFKEAIKIHNDILQVALDFGLENETPVRMCNTELAQDFYRNGKYSTAKKYIDKAYIIAKKKILLRQVYMI